MAKRSKNEDSGKNVNFFIPMVDLVVSIVFVFIIIVMVLILLIKDPIESTVSSEEDKASAAFGQKIPVKPSVLESVVANQTAIEVLTNDVTKQLLEKSGGTTTLNEKTGKLEFKIDKPLKEGE